MLKKTKTMLCKCAALAFATTLLLAACNNEGEATETPKEATPAATVAPDSGAAKVTDTGKAKMPDTTASTHPVVPKN
jgi:hypothetical protein